MNDTAWDKVHALFASNRRRWMWGAWERSSATRLASAAWVESGAPTLSFATALLVLCAESKADPDEGLPTDSLRVTKVVLTHKGDVTHRPHTDAAPCSRAHTWLVAISRPTRTQSILK